MTLLQYCKGRRLESSMKLFTALFYVIVSANTVCGKPLQNHVLESPDPLVHLQRHSTRGLPKPDEERNTLGSDFEFDMVLTPYQRFFIDTHSGDAEPGMAWKRKALRDGTRHWPNATIPYEISPNLNRFQVKWALNAMAEWANNTCIKFYPKTPQLAKRLGHDDFIAFTNGSSCRTMVGRVPGGQNISVGECTQGSIIHELGHTIGYVHEQSRPDRDLNVKIIKDNIIPTRESDFKKYTTELITTYNLPYDYGSIMHYGSTAFSKNGGLTVQTNDPHLQMVIGQRDKLSFLDIQLANDLYNCNDKCDTHKLCDNGGYVGPDCTCVCPEGLTGDTCQHVISSKSCGGLLTSTSGSIQTPDFPMDYPVDTDCFWLIKGPPNSNIVVTFDAFDLDNGEDCKWCTCDFLEVKVYGFSQSGQRYCGTFVQNPIIHNSSSLLLHFHADEIWTMNSGLKFSYSIVSS